MAVDLTTQIIGGCVIALVSGAAGSVFQAYRRRFRLYIIPRAISGKTTSIDEVATIPPDVLRITSRSSYFPELHETESLASIQQIYNTAEHLVVRAPELAKALSASASGLGSVTGADGLLVAIYPVVTQPFFGTFLSAVLVRQREPWTATSHDADIVNITEDADSLLIDPPPGYSPVRIPVPLRYGGGVIRRRIEPLLRALRTANASAVAGILHHLQRSLDDEQGYASDLVSHLRPLIESNSRWSFACHIANYGDSAMVVRPDATLEVVNEHGGDTIKESCSLYQLDGNQQFIEADVGVVLPPTRSEEIQFTTRKRQETMAAGRELRGRFDDGRGKVRVRFEYYTRGIIKHRHATTPWLAFRTPTAGH